MMPYFERDGITIYHGDCREILPLLSPSSCDLVLTDPPYGETELTWDGRVFGWLDTVRPLLSTRGSLWCFGSMRFFLEEAAAFASWRFAQDIVWEKHNGSGLHADRFRRVHEHVLQFYPTSTRWADVHKEPVMTNDATKRSLRTHARPAHFHGQRGARVYVTEEGGPRLMRSVIQARSCHREAVHPTQKPLAVVMPLISYSCPEDGIILDPFMGSGTTLRAAKDLGRKAIGIEISEAYCQIAVRRLEQSVLPMEVQSA
jgi:site-specific DNA-methyltransferase (adenine-specific)